MSALRKLLNLLKSTFENIDDSDALVVLKDIRKENDGVLRGLTRRKILVIAKPIVENLVKQKMAEEEPNTDEEEEISLENDSEEEGEIDRKRRNQRSCDICFRIFSSKQAMVRHMKNLHETNFNVPGCSSCDKTFKTEKALKTHVMLNQCVIVTLHTCERCGKSFKHEKDLKSHSFKHSQVTEKIKCDDCNQSFSKKFNLYQHRERVHGLWNINFVMAKEQLKLEDGTYQCKICEKTFSQKESDKLDAHLSSKCCQNGNASLINDECRFQCTQCDRSYMDKYSLNKHINWKHSQLQTFKCNNCDKVFAQKSSMRRHLKSAHAPVL